MSFSQQIRNLTTCLNLMSKLDCYIQPKVQALFKIALLHIGNSMFTLPQLQNRIWRAGSRGLCS